MKLPRIGRRRATGLAVLVAFAVLAVVGVVWRASWIANQLLHDWAAGAIAEESGGVYQLQMSRVHFNWALRRVRVDSIVLTTSRSVNALRPQALPGLQITLNRCTISGVHFIALARSAGLVASSFGCRSGTLAVEMPVDTSGATPVEPSPAQQQQGFLVFQRGLKLPPYARRIRIRRVVFPDMSVDFRLPRTAKGGIRLELERLQWSMADLVIDPADTTAASRPLFSRTIELAANTFITHPSGVTAVRVGQLRASVTDSTLEIRDVGYAPIGSAESTNSRYRHDRITLAAGHIAAQGIDFGALFSGRGVRARRVEMDSLRITVASDKRLPRDPRRHRRRTPQQWIADLNEDLSMDSVLVRNGELVYREVVPGRTQPGVFTLSGITAAAANVTHVVGRRTSEDPMTVTAGARIQQAGRLDVRVVTPLDAPRFDLTLSGTLSTMPAVGFNAFIVETRALQIERGQVDGIAFQIAVRNGLAVGTIIPRFTDLAVSITRTGSDGIMGRRGMLGGAARGIASWAAGFKLRANNPVRPETPPLVGVIRRSYSPDETLIGFLWFGLRDGLLSVVQK